MDRASMPDRKRKDVSLSAIFVGLAVACAISVAFGSPLISEAHRLSSMGAALLCVYIVRKFGDG